MVVLMLTFLVPINVFAEIPFYITVKPGIYFPRSSDLDSSDAGFNGEIAFGYRFNPNIAAEFGIGYLNTESSLSIQNLRFPMMAVHNDLQVGEVANQRVTRPCLMRMG